MHLAYIALEYIKRTMIWVEFFEELSILCKREKVIYRNSEGVWFRITPPFLYRRFYEQKVLRSALKCQRNMESESRGMKNRIVHSGTLLI